MDEINDLISKYNEVSLQFPLTKTVIATIYQKGWRAFILPKLIDCCPLGGRIVRGNDGKNYLLSRGEGNSARQSLFHELLHILRDQEKGLGDNYFHELAQDILSDSSSLLYRTYEFDCIDKEAKQLATYSSHLLETFHQLHQTDRYFMNHQLKMIHPATIFVPEDFYPQGIPACYYGSLDYLLEEKTIYRNFYYNGDDRNLLEISRTNTY